MDPEQTFIRVQERFSQMLRPKVRATLEYIYLILALTLFAILVVMHANYVQQPGCSSQLSGLETRDAQVIQITIISDGVWPRDDPNSNVIDNSVIETKPDALRTPNNDQELLSLRAKDLVNWIHARRGKLALKFWKEDDEPLDPKAEATIGAADGSTSKKIKDESRSSFTVTARESIRAAITHFSKKWNRRLSFLWTHGTLILRCLQKIWVYTGIHFNVDIPKWLHILYLDKLSSFLVEWLVESSSSFEPTYLYTAEKGYLLLPEAEKFRHNIRTVNVSISAWHSCLGNRWQQLIINRFIGYDTILMNSLLDSAGQGYLYNHQSKEFYNLSYVHELPEGPVKFGDYLVMKCGVLMMSLFVFFTTTMSVSFTLRETQTRMLKFTVQLQHHARNQLPTFQLIFVHVIESLVFVPIMIGILFFLFEFYDDQLLAFMVLILVWLCEIFTLISVRTPISMKFFPRFFLLYFLVFHIYFFSYAYGFSYLALSTTAAFMQHLILYFWNRFEVPALQRFMQHRRSQLQQQPDFHITSSTILASTLHITRLNTGNPGSANLNANAVPGLQMPPNETPNDSASSENRMEIDNAQERIPRQTVLRPNPGNMNSLSSLLLWILGGASSDGLNSFLSMFRDVRDQGQAYTHVNPTDESAD